MVSLGPYNQSYDLSYMYNIRDLRTPYTPCMGTPNTLLSLIRQNPDFSIFNRILTLSKLDRVLNSSQFNGTIFVPSDAYLETKITRDIIINMDIATARNIINYSILKSRVDERILTSSPISYFNSLHSRLLVENINGETLLDKNTKIVKYNVSLSNGIIHVTDNLLIPYIMT